MIRTQIQLSEKQASLLKQLARLQKLSIAELIRRGIDHYIQSASTMDAAQRWERALAAAGRFRSGCSEISTAHDAYLAEAYKK